MPKKQNTIQKTANCQKNWSSKNLIGKNVFDIKTKNCGTIQDFLIDPEKFSVSGVMIKKRFFKEYFLSHEYFDKLSESGLILNSVPILPNKKVVNTEGKSIGRVSRINYDSETNKIRSLEIKSGFTKKIIFSDKIIGIGEKITIQSN